MEELSSETVRNTTAKIVRRLLKMEAKNPDILTQSIFADRIRQRVTAAHELIASRWSHIHQSTTDNIDIAVLQTVQPEHDLDMALPELDVFLREIAARKASLTSCLFKPSSEYLYFHAGELPHDLDKSDDSTTFRLLAMETWVEEHLETWFEQHQQNPYSCGELRRLMEHYHAVASTVYADIPKSMSIMYLTILEIWIKCDTVACSEYPLLREFDPEIRLDEFQCLCLPLKRHMERLHYAENYVSARRKAITQGRPSIYYRFGHPSSFAVQYFDQSPELQTLLSEIERKAAINHKDKCEELAALKEEYADLMEDYDEADCEYQEHTVMTYTGETTEMRHKRGCARCGYRREAKRLSITVYERPLSSDVAVAKATVFELRNPEVFSDWRDASIYLMANVLEFKNAQLRKHPAHIPLYGLDVHNELNEILSGRHEDQRIVLKSESKGLTGSTKKNVQDLQEHQVCVTNALKYAYFDKSMEAWTTALDLCGNLTHKVQYQMPERSRTLGRFLYKPPSTPDGLPVNEPIVRFTQQSSC